MEKLKHLISNSDLSELQKLSLTGFIERAKEDNKKNQEDRQLIEQVANVKNLSEVILSTDEVKIYTVRGKDEWDIECPFRSIYLDKKGTWSRSCTVSPTFDIAFLVYLQNKYIGENSDFADFAMKMLDIKIEEKKENVVMPIRGLKDLTPEECVKIASIAVPHIEWQFHQSREKWDGFDLVVKEWDSSDLMAKGITLYAFQIDYRSEEKLKGEPIFRFYVNLIQQPISIVPIIKYLDSINCKIY